MSQDSSEAKKGEVFILDYSSSERFYNTLLDQVFERLRSRRGVRYLRMDDARQRQIITLHAEGKTLDEIGKRFGVTRERIRQIERKVWNHIGQFRPQLKELERLLVGIVRKGGAFERLSWLKERLQSRFGWTAKEVDYLLDHFLGGLTEKFVAVSEETIVVNDFRCWKCDHFLCEVKSAVAELEQRNGSMTIDEFSHEVRLILETSTSCAKCGRLPKLFSTEMFAWLFGNDSELVRSQEKMTIRMSTQFPTLNRSVLLVLKIAKRPLSKREILDELKTMFPKKAFTLKQIQSTTSNSPQSFDEIFLWDRGGIHTETLYIHRDYIPTHLPILERVERELHRLATKKSVPQIRLNRLFNQHAEACCKVGIPNVYALFSCLKVRGGRGLTFQRSPYIGFAGNRQKISNAKILEDFVIKSDRPVTRQQMRAFGRSLGLQDEHISNTIVLTDLLATQHGYVYLPDFAAEGPDFTELMNRLDVALEKKSSLLITEVYRKERRVCERIGVTDAKMLYSLLRRYAAERYELRYPSIQLKGKQRRTSD